MSIHPRLLGILRTIGLVTLSTLAACGGGGGSTPTATQPVTPPPVQPPALTGNRVSLQSDPGDNLGLGRSYLYTSADSRFEISVKDGELLVVITGDEQWTGVFTMPGAATQLKEGSYPNLTAYIEGQVAPGGSLTWHAPGRSCNNASTGAVTIDHVSYSGKQLTAIDLHFERRCNSASASLHGEIHYSVDDKTVPPLQQAIPASLWNPPANAGPSSGSYLYLESSAGDYVGLGKTYRYTPESAAFSVRAVNADIMLDIAGEEHWSATFRPMEKLAHMAPGYYPGLIGLPANNPNKGGLDWSGEGRGCSALQGWFAIDAISYDGNGELATLDLRFEQHCEGRAAPLRGALHWKAPPPLPALSDSIAPSAAGSWRPAAGSTPGSGNYLYLQSDALDPLGKGRATLQTPANAVFTISANGNELQAAVAGARNASGSLRLGSGTSLVAGSYDRLGSFGSDTGKPAMSWIAGNYSCDPIKGWAVIDSVSYAGGKLAAIDLRFEQVCSRAGGPMRGALHWRADDQTPPPQPAAIPGELWRPAAGEVSASGNYLYLKSDAADYIGQGDNFLFTRQNSVLELSENAGTLTLSVRGDTLFSGSFQVPAGATGIAPGYYAALPAPGQNTARGGFRLGGNGNGCDTTSGVAVDSVSYASGRLASLKLRFEQHCNNGGAALRGQLQWNASDNSLPAGPLLPVPTGLWRAPAGTLPATGNYVYLQSDPQEAVGGGKTVLFTPANASIFFQPNGNTVTIYIRPNDGGNSWTGTFQTMYTLNTLQPGFYDNLHRYPFHNQAFGGQSWTGNGVGCNENNGWMAIDKITYSNGSVTAFHARFIQTCDDQPPQLHGEINWSSN